MIKPIKDNIIIMSYSRFVVPTTPPEQMSNELIKDLG